MPSGKRGHFGRHSTGMLMVANTSVCHPSGVTKGADQNENEIGNPESKQKGSARNLVATASKQRRY